MLILPPPVHAQSSSRGDAVLAAAYVVAIAVDVAQTHYSLRHGGREANPLLGAHPSLVRLDVSAACAAASVIGIAMLLPPRWRQVLLYTGFVVEAQMVKANLRVGIRF